MELSAPSYRKVSEAKYSFVALLSRLTSLLKAQQNPSKFQKCLEKSEASLVKSVSLIQNFQTMDQNLAKNLEVCVGDFIREVKGKEKRTVSNKTVVGILREINAKLTDLKEPPEIKKEPITLDGLPPSVLKIVFQYVELKDLLRLSEVNQKLNSELTNPALYSNIVLNITPFLFKKLSPREDGPAAASGKRPVPPLGQLKPEVLHFLGGKGSLINQINIVTTNSGESVAIIKRLSPTLSYIGFSLGNEVGSEAIFLEERFWIALLEAPSIKTLNLQSTKLSKFSVPQQIKDKVSQILFPPFVHNAYACYDYNHFDNSKEFFSFKAGDKFMILPSSRDLQGWRIAVNESGEKGFVPGNYLVFIDEKKK